MTKKDKNILLRTERHQIPYLKELSLLCHYSKNLYNYTLFIYRQLYFKKPENINPILQDLLCEQSNGKFKINIYDLITRLKDINQIDYRSLLTQTSQQTMLMVKKDYISFMKSLIDYYKHPEKYKKRPSLPHYKEKEGEYVVRFTNQQCHIKDGYIIFPKAVNIKPLKTKQTKLEEVRIIPNGIFYTIEVVYEKTKKKEELIDSRYLGIDFGINNLATCAINVKGLPSLLINGRPVKAINQFYNKQLARFKSLLNNVKTSKHIENISQKRNNRIMDYLHKASCFIIHFCVINKIKNIVLGHNEDWKQNVKLGKRTNQNFTCIPFAKLIQKIIYKAEEIGINVTTTEESYTSKCSFRDSETIEKHEEYAGKRVKRGLFKSALGHLINADVNGSLNIIKKVNPDAFAEGIVGVGIRPLRVNLYKENLLKLANAFY